jgi:hypothetical protein
MPSTVAAAMSTQFYNRAPVYVVDPEAAWQVPEVTHLGVDAPLTPAAKQRH